MMNKFLYGFKYFANSLEDWHELMFDLCAGEPFDEPEDYQSNVDFNNWWFFNGLTISEWSD